MGRVLAAVAAAFALCVGALGLAVYLTRDEDNLQVDNLLSESFTRAVALAPRQGDRVDLRELTPFAWDHVLIVDPQTPRAQVSARLGYEWTGIDPVERGKRLLFVEDGRVVRFADYRGSHRFEGFSEPFDELARDEAVLPVRDVRVLRPATSRGRSGPP